MTAVLEPSKIKDAKKMLEKAEAERAKELRSRLRALPELTAAEPKRPLTSYLLFSEANREKVTALPEIQALEKKHRPVAVSKKLGELWKELDGAAKQKYEKAYEESREKFEVAYNTWLTNLSVEDRVILEERRRLSKLLKPERPVSRTPRDPNRPKRPLTAYMRFASDMWSGKKVDGVTKEDVKQFEGLSVSEKTKVFGALWKKLPEAVKATYKEEFEQEKEVYERLMHNYKEGTEVDEARKELQQAVKASLNAKQTKPKAAAFLLKLGEQFEGSKAKGTVLITYKRYAYVPRKQLKAIRLAAKSAGDAMDVDGAPAVAAPKLPTGDDDQEYGCLVRSVCGKSKISTLVEPKDTEKFQEACGNIMRLHMDRLKKKDKSKKGKEAAAGKGGAAGKKGGKAGAKGGAGGAGEEKLRQTRKGTAKV
ncbi:RNA-binding signal recognition particle subunit srp14 [Phlyctochytrium bullatum]|nr:RNA-binding signal recognition particle subunit srp14 [Phlyctochytrium bullatum]